MSDAISPHQPPPGEQAVPSRRVMIIEDDEDAADSLRELLELDGHQVAIARDALSALELAEHFKPDLVLCDIGLPGKIDGFGLARLWRGRESLRGAHLVALTGFTTPEDRRKAAESGFHSFLGKPPRLDELEKLLANARS